MFKKSFYIFTGYIGGNSTTIKTKNYRETITKNITYELEDDKFTSRTKNGSTRAFLRRRVLTIKNLIVIIMSASRAMQRELDDFFRKLNSADFTIREVTKSAFTQARSKLNAWAFIRLNEIAANTFYNESEYYVWHNMRTLAVDGTRLVLPNSDDIKKEFSQHSFGPNADSPRSMALGSMLYDVLNQITIDSQLAPYTGSEQDLLKEHLNHVKAGDLLLLDRGYPSIALLYLLIAKKIEFCVRMKENWWLKVKDFSNSTEKECIVKFSLPKKDWAKLKDYPELLDKEICCRLIKVELENGEKEILCTSLIDDKKYSYDDFEGLYHLRWNEEEAYKLLKTRIEIENFSGKTALSVRQDFHAKIFLLTLCAAYAHPITERVSQEYKADQDRKYEQQINQTNAIASTREILIQVFLKGNIQKALDAFDHIVAATREIVRPNRKNERKHRPKKLYSMNNKRL